MRKAALGGLAEAPRQRVSHFAPIRRIFAMEDMLKLA
jgi:hypothetical protein